MNPSPRPAVSRSVVIPAGEARLHGELKIPENASGLVLFAHGSGSSRHSPRNQDVARVIRRAGIAILLFDLLTADEAAEDRTTGHLRFDIHLLGQRLIAAARWAQLQPETRSLKIGLFGSSTGAAVAFVAAATLGETIGALVSRSGRPDLAMTVLPRIATPTLLIVGENDHVVRNLNDQAYSNLRCEKRMEIVPAATHLFEEEGAMEEVSRLATQWFARYLRTREAVPC